MKKNFGHHDLEISESSSLITYMKGKSPSGNKSQETEIIRCCIKFGIEVVTRPFHHEKPATAASAETPLAEKRVRVL